MEQKRAMLYPQVDFNTPSAPLPTPTNELSAAQLGVPIEAPPSYDVAIAAHTPAPAPAPATIVIAQPQPQQQPQQLEPTFVQTGESGCVQLCFNNKQQLGCRSHKSGPESLPRAVSRLWRTEDHSHDAHSQRTYSYGRSAHLPGGVSGKPLEPGFEL